MQRPEAGFQLPGISGSRLTRSAVVIFTILGVVAASDVRAQEVGFEFVPFAGVYSPLTSLRGIVAIGDSGAIPFAVDQKPAPAIGTRGTLWLAGPLGLEMSFFYAFSNAELTVGSERTVETAYVLAGSGRLILAFGQQGGPIAFHVDGGVAFIDRGGDAYRNVRGTSSGGGVVAAGARFRINDRFYIRVDAEDYFYELNIRVSGPIFTEGPLGQQFQSDLLLTAGLAIAVGG